MIEHWKQIEGFNGDYEVSSFGRVKSLKRGKPLIMKLSVEFGYKLASLSKKGKTTQYQVGRLVAIAFLPKIIGLNYVDHIDGNRSNNNIHNLRWASYALNARNRSKQQGNFTSKFKGVSWSKPLGKFIARIKIGKHHKYLGCFDSEEKAAIVYDVAAKTHFKEFAKLNILTHNKKV